MQKKTSRKNPPSVKQQGLPKQADASQRAPNNSRGKRTSKPFTAEELRQISEEISLREFPRPASNRLVLMEIDPWNVHAYWHVQASDLAKRLRRLKAKGLTSRLVLRFHDVSSGQDQNGVHERFDIEVTEDSRNWYVNLWRDGKHYSAEIGLSTEDGSFESLATSNQISTPRAYPSADLDFYMVNAHVPAMPEPAARIIPRASNEDLLRNLFPQRFSSGGEFPWIDQSKSILPPDEPAFPELGATEAEQVEESPDFPLLAHHELEKFRTSTSQSKEKFLAGTQLPLLADPPAGAVAPAGLQLDARPSAVPVASGPDEGLHPPQAESSNVSAEPREAPGISVIRQGWRGHRFAALEMYLGNSDSSSSIAEDAYKIEAKLLIEGKYTPDTHLLFFGEKVNVEPDGTFCIKQPLERGPELLEFMYRVISRKNKE